MALSIELLKAMDGQHAVNALRADFNPLVNTELEALLIDWCENLLDEAADSEPISAILADHDLETKDIKELADALIENVETTVAILVALGEADISTADHIREQALLIDVLDAAGIDGPDQLKAQLALADQFRTLANDAGDVFSRLTELTTGATA